MPPTQTNVSVSAGAIVINMHNGIPRMLLMVQNNKRYGRPENEIVWDIGPKGRIEKGERVINTIRRETKEEVGISPVIDHNFRIASRFKFEAVDSATNKKYLVRRKVIYVIAYASDDMVKDIRLSPEHLRYKLVPVRQALEQKSLKRGQKKVIREVLKYLKKNSASIQSKISTRLP